MSVTPSYSRAPPYLENLPEVDTLVIAVQVVRDWRKALDWIWPQESFAYKRDPVDYNFSSLSLEIVIIIWLTCGIPINRDSVFLVFACR